MKKILALSILSLFLFGISGNVLANPGDPCCANSDCNTAARETCSNPPSPCDIHGSAVEHGICVAGAHAANNNVSGPSACCKIGHTFKAFPNSGGTKTTFEKGCVIGEQNGSCKLTKKSLTNELTEGGTCGATDVMWFKYWGMACMLNTIYIATNWLFMILMLIAVIMIVVGGFYYITAAGNPEKAGTGGKIIVYALIGIAIALFAKVIPSIIRFIMGV